MNKALLSIGHGYSAQALAEILVPLGWTIYGTRRTAEKAAELEPTGVTPVVWPGLDLSGILKSATHVLMSAAPDDDGDPFLRQVVFDAPKLEWAGYLSTTGVYGDHDGGWVNEQTTLTPSTWRGKLRVAAEQQWQGLGVPLHIFRLAGIYGPGRGPFAKVRNGTARRIVKPNQVFSRIHVDDIAQVLAASIARSNPGAIYNLCDDDPAPPQDVIAYAAQLLQADVPPAEDFESAEMSPMARSFYAESKRVDNTKIKAELGVQLRFPTYKAGLSDLLQRVKL